MFFRFLFTTGLLFLLSLAVIFFFPFWLHLREHLGSGLLFRRHWDEHKSEEKKHGLQPASRFGRRQRKQTLYMYILYRSPQKKKQECDANIFAQRVAFLVIDTFSIKKKGLFLFPVSVCCVKRIGTRKDVDHAYSRVAHGRGSDTPLLTQAVIGCCYLCLLAFNINIVVLPDFFFLSEWRGVSPVRARLAISRVGYTLGDGCTRAAMDLCARTG